MPQGQITIVLKYEVAPDSYPGECETLEDMVKYDEKSFRDNTVNLEDIVSWYDEIVSVEFKALPPDPAGTEPLPGT